MIDTIEHILTLKPAELADMSEVAASGARSWNQNLVYFIKCNDGTIEGPKHIKTILKHGQQQLLVKELKQFFDAGQVWVACTEYEKEVLTNKTERQNENNDSGSS